MFFVHPALAGVRLTPPSLLSLSLSDGPSDSPQVRGARIVPTVTLAALVARIAAVGDLWRPLVRHDPIERWYTRLLLTDTVEVWLIGWAAGQHTTVHDHGGALGALCVAEGKAHRGRLRPAVAPLRMAHPPASAAGDLHG